MSTFCESFTIKFGVFGQNYSLKMFVFNLFSQVIWRALEAHLLGIPFSILFSIPVMILGIVCHLCCTVHWALPRLLESFESKQLTTAKQLTFYFLNILLFIFQFRYRNNDAIA